MSLHADLLGRLLPPVSYDPNEPSLATELTAEGAALDRTQSDSDALAREIIPFYAQQLLPDWERVCGLTPALDAPLQQRIASVVAKINETGGLSIPYFKRLAQSLGYAIEIVEPQPFRVDESRVGEALYIEDIIYEWEVVVQGAPTLLYWFRVDESAVGESLLSFGDPVIEAVFQDLKPAHTFVSFSYQE